jgi:hypothetical protein
VAEPTLGKYSHQKHADAEPDQDEVNGIDELTDGQLQQCILNAYVRQFRDMVA